MRFLVVGLAVVVFGEAFAPAVQAQDVNCKEPQTQLDMTICAKKDWEAADVELNAAYKSAMAAMKQTDSYLSGDLKGAAETLKAAQRAWIPFRDKACESYGFLARGGSMEPMLVLQCRADLTRQRTSELKDLTQGLGN
ncbi:lysozyme inhibitor LprI family protein [Roseibium sp.]|uniref:lysozyme inhibitor LprI family protein n=1 Tax=Roseibium sp. TaxID=1936156 RepID=UPI0039192954